MYRKCGDPYIVIFNGMLGGAPGTVPSAFQTGRTAPGSLKTREDYYGKYNSSHIKDF